MGMYFARLEINAGLAWINQASNLFTSDQGSETYGFLGQSPAMRQWVGGRDAKALKASKIAIDNLHYEATLEFLKRDVRRDKTPQIRARIADFADRAQTHWANLLSTLIVNGATTACYDGANFFSTTHSEESSGTQSNNLSVTIASLPALVHGSTTAPSMEEMQQSIIKGIVQIMSFVDNVGEPMNENATEFLVIVPTSLYMTALSAISSIATAALQQNFNPDLISNFKISVQMNPRLNSSWTTKFLVVRTDASLKPLIRQTEQEVELKAKAEGSEFEFDNDAWQFGIDAWRGVGYGYWQYTCLVTMA